MSQLHVDHGSAASPARRGSLLGLATLLLGLFALLLAVDGASNALAAAPPAASTAADAHDHHEASTAPGRPATTAAAKPAPGSATFTGDRAETERLLAYDAAIVLTPQQEAVRVEALTPLAAPCCKEFSAATCCCRCNMKRATDGLAKHLIADLGADAKTVRSQVSAWQHAINPDGFSGDTCSTGGCGRPFKANGCGGMNPAQLVF